jgi:phosphatidylinositol alpha-mannosyltransferase
MGRAMRILQACPYSWDMHGGVQAHIRHLSSHLERLGHEVIVLAPGVRRLDDSRLRIVGRPLHLRFNGSMTSVCLGARSLLVARAIMQDFQPDIVHVHEPLCPGVSMAATMLAAAPVVGTFHAYYDPSVASALYTAEAKLLWLIWRRVDLGLAVSRAAADCIESRVKTSVRVIPNGIDTVESNPTRTGDRRSPRRLLFVGRLERRKGFPVVVQAFATLASRFPDLFLVVVGDGPDRAIVDRLPTSLRSRVVMRGTCPDAALVREYTGADLFIAPALGSESFGIVLLEAMSAGLPVVASDIPGYREVVRDSIEALLVPPGDPSALAVAVARILADPEYARGLGERGRRRAREYSWDAVARRVEAVYAEAVSRARVSAGHGRRLAPETIRRFIPRW